MKKIQRYTLLLVLLSLGSCSEDFLNTEPITELTDANFYKTIDDAYTALIGCYDGMQIATGSNALGFVVASEVLSDDCYGGTGTSDGYGFQAVDEFDIGRSPADTDMYIGPWKNYYSAVYRCNVLLSKIDQINWEGNETLRNTYVSEARFIRAYLYFEMIRLWGNIPLLTAPSQENLPQAQPSEVYTVIAEDLLYAANNLPTSSYTSVQNGRITRWAAKSVLARVYLYYTGYYGQPDLAGLVSQAEALAHLEDVIAESGHTLVADFATLWPSAAPDNYAGEDNPEVVFSIKYTYTSDYDGNTDGNHWMVMFGMRGLDYDPYGAGWGVTVNEKLWNAYSPGDTRAAATVIAIEEEGVPLENIDGQREYTGYYNKKYSPATSDVISGLGGVNFQIGQFQDYIVMRYADVLLMAAELGSANAQTYFDMVRQRAYQGSFAPLAVTQENIMEERHLEFALEGVRYWDLLRQGINTAAAEIAETATVLNGGVETSKVISAGNIQATQGLQQIPNSQITLSNGVLQQNTGW